MPDYSQGKIYIIRSYKTDDVYIGSTTREMSLRMTHHKYKSNNTSSKELIAHGDAYIELIELYPCANRQELVAREGFHIKGYSNCVNKCIAGRTRKETEAAYYAANSVSIRAQRAAYYQRKKKENSPTSA